MVFRRFGFLQARLLLEKQDSLRQLEAHLDLLDRSETQDEQHKQRLCNRDIYDEESACKRTDLMSAIERTFRGYGLRSNFLLKL